jgi:hypothetical protein
MTQPMRQPSVEEDEERRNRERMLDETLEDSFPASDPLSTNPNPDNHGADDREPAVEEEDDEDRGRTSPPTRNTTS